MHDPSRDEVIDSIQQGIMQSQTDYRKAAWLPICQGPEYLMTVYIFKSLLKLTRGDSLTLEVKPKVILDYLKAKKPPGRKPKSARLDGRGDICLWLVGTDKPRAIIEVKKYASQCHKDLDRVTHLLNRGLEFGILASCIQERVKNSTNANMKKRIRDSRQSIYEAIREQLNSKSSLAVELVRYKIEPLTFGGDTPDVNEDWLWCPVIFTIYRKRNRQ